MAGLAATTTTIVNSIMDKSTAITISSLDSLPFDSIYLFLITKFVFWYGLAFTSAQSRLRPIIFLIIAVTGLAAVRSRTVYLIPGAVACDWIIGVIIHSSNFLLIAKRVPPPEATSIQSKAYWAFLAIFAGRWNVPHPPKFSDKDPSYVPSRRKLFIQRFLDFAICFTIASRFEKIHIYSYQDPGGFFSRLDEVSIQELILRVFLMLKGLLIPCLGLRACHCFATCVALLFGAEPKDWPPLYGSIKEAYTVRRFYSHFWHHAMRRALTAHGVLATYYVVWMVTLSKPKTLKFPAARYLTTIFTFLASAGMHVLTCPRMELHMIRPELWLHLGTASAIMLEDLVMKTYFAVWKWAQKGQNKLKTVTERTGAVSTSTCLTASRQRKTEEPETRQKIALVEKKSEDQVSVDDSKSDRRVSILWYGVGYVWVIMFWTWSVSSLMFSLYNR